MQLLPVLEEVLEPTEVTQLLTDAAVLEVPDGSAMIPEAEAARLHGSLRRNLPAWAGALAAKAGRRTADYILAHRIPRQAQRLLRAMPAALAAPPLAKAIEKHAWTFAGSGRFRRVDAWTFEIEDNPLIRGEHSDIPLCTWHTAVFERLYQELVSPDCKCREVQCGAQAPGQPCRFEITLAR